MLNVLRPALSRVLTPVAELLARTPVTPNAITIIGTAGVAAGALWLFPIGHLFAGTMVCTGFVLADMLDGLLARVKGTSGAFGAFLDSTLDRIGDAAVFAGLTIWLVRTGQQGLAWVALFTLVAAGLTGLGVPYVLAIGLWALAALSVVTFGQRVDAVRRGAAGRPVPPVLAGNRGRDHGGEPDDPRS